MHVVDDDFVTTAPLVFFLFVCLFLCFVTGAGIFPFIYILSLASTINMCIVMDVECWMQQLSYAIFIFYAYHRTIWNARCDLQSICLFVLLNLPILSFKTVVAACVTFVWIGGVCRDGKTQHKQQQQQKSNYSVHRMGVRKRSKFWKKFEMFVEMFEW